jgi:NAD(P)-dependent dehydrogenase (short-subunit alcohol dehydrogenase family)
MGMLDGKVAIVTNSGAEIGRAIALSMVDEGARVVVHDSEAVAQEIRDRGGETVACPASVISWEGSHALVQTALDAFGHLDILVNSPNADVGFGSAMISEIKKEEWELVHQATLKAAFLCTRAALPQMRKQRQGRLVHLVFPEALLGGMGHAHHGAAQMAVVGLSRNAAIEMERYHVTSNCIVPFRYRDGSSGPADVAPLVVFLASDAARKLTGQIFGVQGREVSLFSQARIQRSIHNSGGWTVERLCETFEPTMRPYFTPLEPS